MPQKGFSLESLDLCFEVGFRFVFWSRIMRRQGGGHWWKQGRQILMEREPKNTDDMKGKSLTDETDTGRAEGMEQGKLPWRRFGKAMWKHTILSAKFVCMCVRVHTDTHRDTEKDTHNVWVELELPYIGVNAHPKDIDCQIKSWVPNIGTFPWVFDHSQWCPRDPQTTQSILFALGFPTRTWW